MPLMNSQGNGNIFELPSSPTSSKSGDLWYDTTNNRENLNIAGTMRIIIPSSLTTGDMLYFDGTNFVRLPVGTASQVLQGGTVPAWGSAVNYSELVTVNLGGAASSLSSGTFTAKKNLLVIINVTSLGGAQDLQLQFNADVGANYNSYLLANGVAGTQTGATAIYLDVETSTVDHYFIMHIRNETTIKKYFNAIGNAGLTMDLSSGNWNNTLAQITAVKLLATAGVNLGTGTTMTILGFDE